uniref:Uncharacterized protein n=1 Tax=Anguilla anguilla TaxID=7936 RepID=A0A0E9UZ13_ANGAN
MSFQATASERDGEFVPPDLRLLCKSSV